MEGNVFQRSAIAVFPVNWHLLSLCQDKHTQVCLQRQILTDKCIYTRTHRQSYDTLKLEEQKTLQSVFHTDIHNTFLSTLI